MPAGKIDRLPPSYQHDPQTGKLIVWDEAAGGRGSRPPAFQPDGGGLVSTVDDYHANFRMLLNGGRHGDQRTLSRPAVELMTTNRPTPASGHRAVIKPAPLCPAGQSPRCVRHRHRQERCDLPGFNTGRIL
ncbi:hypothetical protein [Nonomuraea jabiensis]|uniref:hypothetical protein n=1 Tax=Nonomuraea jabiensis TaxID=882448 RepID=UPI003D74D934